MVSFYAFPEIFIDIVTANRHERKLTHACFEHIIFSQKGTLIKKAGVRTPWTSLDLPLSYCLDTYTNSARIAVFGPLNTKVVRKD